jgi:hypothetical protein
MGVGGRKREGIKSELSPINPPLTHLFTLGKVLAQETSALLISHPFSLSIPSSAEEIISPKTSTPPMLIIVLSFRPPFQIQIQ